MGHIHPSSLLETPEPVPSPYKERVEISMPVEVGSRIMNKVLNVPGDSTNEDYGLNPACGNTTQKPIYAEIVRKVRSTARRKTGQTIS